VPRPLNAARLAERLRWTLLLAAMVLASCGGAGGATTSGAQPTATAARTAAVTATTPPRPTRFDTANAPGLTVSQQEIYEQAKFVCAIKPARGIAADFDMQTGDHERIVARYSRGYDQSVRTAASVGCREGLAAYAKNHAGK
jgi:ABC-type transport system substrate-binding protein